MASQPPPLNEMEEISETIPFKDSMPPQESTEMLQQHDAQTISYPILARGFNMMNLDSKNLQDKDSQKIGSVASRLFAMEEPHDAIMKAFGADSTTSMMQVNQKALEINERPRTPSQSSESPLKEIQDLPQPFVDLNNLRILSKSSNLQEKKIQEQAKTPLTITPEEIAQSSNDFNKTCIAHPPSNVDLDKEDHNKKNQQASNKSSYSSANSDPQQKILRDIQKYCPVNSTGNYGSIELNRELLNVDTTSLDLSEQQVPQYEQENSDMMWLQRAWSRATEALSAGEAWKGMESEQKAAFERAIIYRAQHKELDSSSLRLQMDKFTARILFVIEGLQAPACSPTSVDLKNILKGAQSFNTLSHEKCNILMAAQRNHNKHDFIDSLKSETLRRASEHARSIESTQPDSSNYREEDPSSKHPTGRVIQQLTKNCGSDSETKGLKDLPEKQATFMDGARQKELVYKTLLLERKKYEERKLNDSGVHTSRESLSEITKAAHAQVKANTLLTPKEKTHTTPGFSTYNTARGETTANLDRAKESDRARDFPTQDSITNTASDDFSFQVIFQENLNALKIMQQKCQEEIALYSPGRNIDLNDGDAVSQEASRASERTWYLERKAYLQTLRQTRQYYEQNKSNEIHQDRELDARRNDATCLDRSYFKDYRYMTFPELNEMREAKEEFKASIADAYCAYLAARSAKDDAFTKMETAVAERKDLSMGILRRNESLENPKLKKSMSDADEKFAESKNEYSKRAEKTFEEKIEAINRACSDSTTQKTEPSMDNSICSTFAADHDSVRVIFAHLESHYTAMSAKSNLQSLRTIDHAWTDGHYGFLEKSMRDQKQRNNSISSNNYITVEEHAPGQYDNYDQEVFQAYLPRHDKVAANCVPKTLKTNLSPKPLAVTVQDPNPGCRSYQSIKSTDRAEYMTMFEEWKPKPSHSDIMKAMILGRAVRGRQLADKQPVKFDHATFQHLRQWGYSRPDTSISTDNFAAVASTALDLLAVDYKAAIEVNKISDVTTTHQAVNNKVNPINETIANAEMTAIDNLAPNEFHISDTDNPEITSKDVMQESLVLDLPSVPPSTPEAASSPIKKVDLEYNSDIQSDASWVMPSDDDRDDVAEAGAPEELESVEESEEVEEWEMF
ncbi:uncharacterized protein EAF01_011374 [Botrytis porri]|uniref:uncharacterized protein n=1 Tax=Botrytis porri TaxID=87229 RepID=UPI00190042ED|nr:uncharacterized protein EAF01_011374 [Botrytis porri]KAF7885309.1 hypothetical protein EAF01_011374 [Botrytis porri]